jgi:hypothetical protein
MLMLARVPTPQMSNEQCSLPTPSSPVREKERERDRDIKRERGRERKREREGERERERERETWRERCRIWLLNLKGMKGALAPFSCLVIYESFVKCYVKCFI